MGPPLPLLAVTFATLFLASVIGVAIATSGAQFPSPFDPVVTLSTYLSRHHTALQLGAFLQFASAIVLGILTAAIVARIHHLGIRAPGATIAVVAAFSRWMLPPALALGGIAIALLAELSTLSLVVHDAAILLPIARFAAIAWLIAAAALLPRTRPRRPSATSTGATHSATPAASSTPGIATS